MPTKLLAFATISGASILMATTLMAETIRYSTFQPDRHLVNRDAIVPFSEELKADENVNLQLRIISGGQLLSAAGSFDGVSGGLADAAFVVPVYSQAELPIASMLFNMFAFGDSNVAGMGAIFETIFVHCPDCLDEFKSGNTVPLAMTAAGQFYLYCVKPVNTVTDLQGLKVRAQSAGAKIIEEFGGVPVNINPTEAAPALQQGALDCVLGPLSWLTAYGFLDVAPNVVDVPMGNGKTLFPFVFNKSAWQSLSVAEREAIWNKLPSLSARAAIEGYWLADLDIFQRQEEMQLSVSEGDGSFSMALRAYALKEIEEATEAAESLGVKNGAEIIAIAQSLLPKWNKISEEVGMNADLFAEALKREIYDRADFSTFLED